MVPLCPSITRSIEATPQVVHQDKFKVPDEFSLGILQLWRSLPLCAVNRVPKPEQSQGCKRFGKGGMRHIGRDSAGRSVCILRQWAPASSTWACPIPVFPIRPWMILSYRSWTASRIWSPSG